MRARVGAIGNAVAIDIKVTPEILAGFELGGGHHLAAVHAPRVVPHQRFAQAVVHADVEVGHQEHRRLQTVGQVEALRAELETLMWVFGEQQHVFGVAVGGVGAADHVSLLGARRHAGARPAALHVDDGDRDLGEVREADELGHQRHTRP